MDTASIKYVTLRYGKQMAGAIKIDPMCMELFKNNPIDETIVKSTFRDEVLYRCLVNILEHSNPREIIYRTPLTWWDHFKRDKFPEWLLKRYPYKFSTEVVKIEDTYPMPKERMLMGRKLGDCIRIATLEGYPGGHYERED